MTDNSRPRGYKVIPPDVRMVDGQDILWEDWSYIWAADGHAWRIDVPEGFIFDGASVPRILWSLTGLTPHGELESAALIHDFLYRYGGHLPQLSFWRVPQQSAATECWAPFAHVWTRQQCDRLFARIMRETGVPRWRRRLAYLGVRAGGWRFFKRSGAQQ